MYGVRSLPQTFLSHCTANSASKAYAYPIILGTCCFHLFTEFPKNTHVGEGHTHVVFGVENVWLSGGEPPYDSGEGKSQPSISMGNREDAIRTSNDAAFAGGVRPRAESIHR